MELHAKLRGEATSRERCPYCHDALGEDTLHDERIECPGCRTTHHRACIAELGRCTIRGCERPISVPVVAPAELAGKHSAIHREVQRRIRERVRTFVRDHVRANEAPGSLVERRDAALRQAEIAEAEDDLAAAAEWYHEVARLQRTARPDELPYGQRTDHADAYAAHATRLDRRAARRVMLVTVSQAIGALFLFGLVIAVIVALRLVR